MAFNMYQNVKLKEDFLDMIDQTYTSVEDGKIKDATIKKCYTLFGDDQLGRFEQLFNKDIYDFTKEELLMAYSSIGFSNISGLRSINTMTKKYIDYAFNLSNSPVKVVAPATSFIDDNDLKGCISKLKQYGKYMTYKELTDSLKYLVNDLDRVIPIAIWHGILGVGYSELNNLRKIDFSLEDQTLNADGKIVKLNDIEAEIFFRAIQETEYEIENNNPKVQEQFTSYKVYDSNFILRHIDAKKSGKDIDYSQPLNDVSLKNRIARIKKSINKPYWSGMTIYQSGIVYRMLQEKQDWTVQEIEQYLKNNEIKSGWVHMVDVLEIMKEKLKNEEQ